MVKNPPEGMPRVTPYLFYNDIEAALEWLEKTFGFETSFRLPDPTGKLVHAEMKYKSGVIMLGVPQEEGTASPATLKGATQSLYIYVNRVEEHYRHAKEAGAIGITEPMEMFWGDKMYTAQDPEGHRWSFAEHVKDIAPEDMKPDFS
jgi:uncharacterized glyoxalase superfamily protein PhnB